MGFYASVLSAVLARGLSPARPRMPAGCDIKVSGTWTQGHAVVDRISRKKAARSTRPR